MAAAAKGMTTEEHSRVDLQTAIAESEFPVGVFRTDLKGVCFAVNPRWCELSGLTEAESLGYGWLGALHPEDRERVMREQAEHLAAGKNLRIEFRIRQPGGNVIWVLSQAVASRDAEGRLAGFVGTITEITDRVRAENALRESETRFRNLVELSPDFIAIHRAGIMCYVNAAGRKMMAASDPNDLLGHHILEFVLAEHQAVAIERMRSLQQGSEIALAEMEVQRCDGVPIWIETIASMTVWEGEPAVQLVARDVTERRRVAESYRIVVETVRDAMWVMDRGNDGQWRATFVNSSYLKQTKLGAPDEVLHKTLWELADMGITSVEAAERSISRYEAASHAERPTEFEYNVDWNGLRSYITTSMTPVRDDSGRCYRLICWSRDLTRRRMQEQALAESEANFRSVVEGTSDAVWVMDRGSDDIYRVRLANPRTRDLLGLTPERVVGKHLHEFLTKEAADAALERYRQVEEAGAPIEYETVIDRSGVRTEMVTHLTPIFDAGGRCIRIIGSARDVTDRRRAETALLQAQKLESLGVLAGGIAHDFNTLLTTILGNLYLLDSELPAESPLHIYANDSKVAAERGADLVRRLLGFSRPGLRSNERVSLEHLFGETASLVQRTLGPSVELAFERGPEDDTLLGEFSSLQQVLVNLLLNARDAMPEGGRIRVARRIRVIGTEQLWVQRGIGKGRYHEVTVTDSGSGMSRDLVQRIFDPFFTTKGVGKGTGLGLSTAFSIVRAHGGWLEAESEEGEGSTFRMLLPAG